MINLFIRLCNLERATTKHEKAGASIVLQGPHPPLYQAEKGAQPPIDLGGRLGVLPVPGPGIAMLGDPVSCI